MIPHMHGQKPPPLQSLVKLGGAAITAKSRLETLQPEVLASVCACLATQSSLVVVHGAGSFGHHQASNYAVAKGLAASKEGTKGFALTR